MADVREKIELLQAIRQNTEVFLPVVDHAWKVFPNKDTGTEWYDDPVYNIGWDAGIIDGNRPYFLECWATSGITMLTYFVSTVGMENAATKDLIKMLTDADLVQLKDPEHPRVSVMKFEDSRGNEFFSINVTVGVEDETYATGGRIYPFAPLNDYNSLKYGGG